VLQQHLAIEYYNHLETDQFWMVDGEYKFDMSRIKEAHQWCQDKTKSMLNMGQSVVVSNTFTTQKEMKPYFDMAKELWHPSTSYIVSR